MNPFWLAVTWSLAVEEQFLPGGSLDRENRVTQVDCDRVHRSDRRLSIAAVCFHRQERFTGSHHSFWPPGPTSALCVGVLLSNLVVERGGGTGSRPNGSALGRSVLASSPSGPLYRGQHVHRVASEFDFSNCLSAHGMGLWARCSCWLIWPLAHRRAETGCWSLPARRRILSISSTSRRSSSAACWRPDLG